MTASPGSTIALSAVASVLVIGLLSACAGSGGELSTPQKDSAVERQDEGGIEIPRSEGRQRGMTACFAAEVAAASNPRAIDFLLKCEAAPRGGEPAVVITRYSPARPDRLNGLLAYRRGPRVVGRGAVTRRGSCTWHQDFLACGPGRIDGPVVLRGRLWVELGDRCRSEVSVVSVAASRCSGGACGGAPRLSQLFQGRPEGCQHV